MSHNHRRTLESQTESRPTLRVPLCEPPLIVKGTLVAHRWLVPFNARFDCQVALAAVHSRPEAMRYVREDLCKKLGPHWVLQ